MQKSDIPGLVAIVSLLIAILCAINGQIFDYTILCKLAIVFANIAIVCFIIFVILSAVF